MAINTRNNRHLAVKTIAGLRHFPTSGQKEGNNFSEMTEKYGATLTLLNNTLGCLTMKLCILNLRSKKI